MGPCVGDGLGIWRWDPTGFWMGITLLLFPTGEMPPVWVLDQSREGAWAVWTAESGLTTCFSPGGLANLA